MASAQQRGLLGRLADRMKRLFEKNPQAPALSPSGAALLEGVGWTEFERQVAVGFRHRGYAVSGTGGGGAGAVDMVLHRGEEIFLVDCKPWRSLAVGVAPLQELRRLVAERRADGGFAISSGVFSDEAVQFAMGHGIVLIDGSSLRELLDSRGEKTLPLVRRQAPFLDTTLPPSAWKASLGRACPLCASPMAERATPGGRAKLVCSRFPRCDGERVLP